jgi:hypothetical protein
MTDRHIMRSRELDSRDSDGAHIRLLWDEIGGGLTVTVVDWKRRESFLIEVPDGVRSLDVFHHPYAYADAGTRRHCGATGQED